LKTIGTNSRVSRACLSQRAASRLSYCSSVGYLKGNISTLVTGNDSRNLSAECRLAVSVDRIDLQRILNENIEMVSLSLPRIHLIFAQIDIAKELSAASNQLFFYFFHPLKIPYIVRDHVRLTETKQNSNFQSLTRAFRSIILFKNFIIFKNDYYILKSNVV